jgi:hypothetical protein
MCLLLHHCFPYTPSLLRFIHSPLLCVPISKEGKIRLWRDSVRIFRLSIADFTTFNTTCRLALPSELEKEGVAVETSL